MTAFVIAVPWLFAAALAAAYVLWPELPRARHDRSKT